MAGLVLVAKGTSSARRAPSPRRRGEGTTSPPVPSPSQMEKVDRASWRETDEVPWATSTLPAVAMIIRCLLLLVVLFCAPSAMAQETPADTAPKTVVIDKRKLLVQPRNADGSVILPAFRDDPVFWLQGQQQNFSRAMASSIRQLRAAPSASAGWTLFFLSFLYGVLHAAGPGHGKAVISGWVLATENELRRGILIAFMSAMIQALTAIFIVGALVLLVHNASAMARDVAGFLESASYAMIAAMGLYLAWTGLRRMAPKVAARPIPALVGEHQFELVSRPQAPGSDYHIHDDNCGCGHAHAPAAAAVRGDWSLSRAVALAFSVGIRPCSGAILVLITSYSLGLFWAGVASTLAMGFGVFLTISAIAALAVFAKSTALRFAAADNPALVVTVKIGKLVVGLGIAALGAVLFWASLGGVNGSL